MTPAAWVMLIVTWSIVIFYTVKYFWMVLTLPAEPETRDSQRERAPGDGT